MINRKTIARVALSVTAVVALGIVLMPHATGQSGAAAKPSTKNGEWPFYTADEKGSKYSPLDQINGSNFNKLEVAWRFKTDNLGPRPEFKLEGTPLMVKGVVYTTGGTRRSVVALDGATGEVLWTHSFREGKRAAMSPRQLSGRGVAYWTDGKGDDRIIYITTGYRMIQLHAKDGSMVASFGKDGVLDLKVGMVTGVDKQIDLETGEVGLHSTPLVAGDVVLVGSAFKEGMTVSTRNNTKGMVRAFDVRTGKQIWAFHTIPQKGQFGYDTWENGSADYNGNTGVWTQMTVDLEAGLAYLPVESPTSDYYGGERPGDNLFGESLVCVDLKTGVRKWHFQIVHHPIWDYDLSSAPILADINVDGKAIKAVALPSKEAFLYVFDRISGKPVWPIEERAVPQSDVPGEKTAKTQPFPTKPPAYGRNFFNVPDDLIDFTPEMRATAKDQIARYKTGPMFLPPVIGDPAKFLGAINLGNASGGTNWPGAGYDPETQTVYAQANQSAVTPISLRTPPQNFSDIKYVSGRNDQEFRVAEGPGYGSAADYLTFTPGAARRTPPPPPAAGEPAAGRGAPGRGGAGNGLQVQGLSIIKPPYGVVSAVNLNKGTLEWKVPYGETPDNVRNHPALKGLNIGNTGQGGSVGLLVTKTLVVLGDSQVTTSDHPRGAMLRAHDKKTGKQVGAVWMPAPQSGSPMTYSLNGKQYIVVAVSGGAYSGEFIAFALPEAN